MVVEDEAALMKGIGFTETTTEEAKPADTPAVTTTEAANNTAATTVTAATPPATDTPAEVEIQFGSEIKENKETPATPTFNAKEALGVDLPVEEIKTRISKWEEVQKELADLKNKNPYANDKVKRYNEAMSKGVSEEAFFKVDGVDVDKLTPLEKVVTQLMWSEGLTEEKAKMLANHKYGLDIVVDDLASDAEKAAQEKTKQLAELNLEMDAKKAGEFLSQFKVKALEAPVVAEQAKSNADEVWKPHVPEIVKGFAEMKIGDFTYKVPKEALAEAESEILATLKAIGQNSSPTDAKDIETVKNMVSLQLKATQFDSAMKGMHAHFAKKLIEVKNNPSALRSEADLGGGRQSASSNIDAMVKEMASSGY